MGAKRLLNSRSNTVHSRILHNYELGSHYSQWVCTIMLFLLLPSHHRKGGTILHLNSLLGTLSAIAKQRGKEYTVYTKPRRETYSTIVIYHPNLRLFVHSTNLHVCLSVTVGARASNDQCDIIKSPPLSLPPLSLPLPPSSLSPSPLSPSPLSPSPLSPSSLSPSPLSPSLPPLSLPSFTGRKSGYKTGCQSPTVHICAR